MTRGGGSLPRDGRKCPPGAARRWRATLLAFALLVGAVWLAGGPGFAGGETLALGSTAPELGGGPWIGSAPLTMAGLRGRVVLVEFWTYG